MNETERNILRQGLDDIYIQRYIAVTSGRLIVNNFEIETVKQNLMEQLNGELEIRPCNTFLYKMEIKFEEQIDWNLFLIDGNKHFCEVTWKFNNKGIEYYCYSCMLNYENNDIIYNEGRIFKRNYYYGLIIWSIILGGILLTILLETLTDKADQNFSSVDTLILLLSYWGLIPYLVSTLLCKHGRLSDHLACWQSSKHISSIDKTTMKYNKLRTEIGQKDIRQFLSSKNTEMFGECNGTLVLDEYLNISQLEILGMCAMKTETHIIITYGRNNIVTVFAGRIKESCIVFSDISLHAIKLDNLQIVNDINIIVKTK